MCKEADTSTDPVMIALSGSVEGLCWGYPAYKDGSQQEHVCFYCLMIYLPRFKHLGLNRADVIEKIGTRQADYERFDHYLKSLIQ